MLDSRWLQSCTDPIDVEAANQRLESASAEVRLAWAHQMCGDALVVTSSFGAESALMLHLVTEHLPKIPVVFIDTGFLFSETYRFAEQLKERFQLDLRVYTPRLTSARLEALYGKLWEGDSKDLEAYLKLTKVEPMYRALSELKPKGWLSAVRHHQTEFRRSLRTVETHQGVLKVHPIVNWSEQDVADYMRKHDLPYHPLVQRGYRSIGDEHSTVPTLEGEDARAGRNLGAKRECGIHLPPSAYPRI